MNPHLQQHNESGDAYVRRVMGPAMVGIATPEQAELIRELGEDYVRWCRQSFGRRIIQRLHRRAGRAARRRKPNSTSPALAVRVDGAA